jgi:gliding motility-associated lipoprotein GldH
VKRKSLLFIPLAALFFACGKGVVFQADAPIPDERWVNTYKPEFTFDVTDTVTEHDVYIDIRHTGDYDFSDLWLFSTINGPGLKPVRDTAMCVLARPTGEWLGKGLGFIFSDRFEAHVLWKVGNRFPRTGRYTIQLEQAMRVDTLAGIIDVGVSVERSKKKAG